MVAVGYGGKNYSIRTCLGFALGYEVS